MQFNAVKIAPVVMSHRLPCAYYNYNMYLCVCVCVCAILYTSICKTAKIQHSHAHTNERLIGSLSIERDRKQIIVQIFNAYILLMSVWLLNFQYYYVYRKKQ